MAGEMEVRSLAIRFKKRRLVKLPIVAYPVIKLQSMAVIDPLVQVTPCPSQQFERAGDSDNAPLMASQFWLRVSHSEAITIDEKISRSISI
jgi:hypothetical protein